MFYALFQLQLSFTAQHLLIYLVFASLSGLLAILEDSKWDTQTKDLSTVFLLNLNCRGETSL